MPFDASRDAWPHVWLVPPFPNACRSKFAVSVDRPLERSAGLADRLRDARVGGCFWGQRPDVTAARLIRRTSGPNVAAIDEYARAAAGDAIVWGGAGRLPRGPVDVWHLFDSVTSVTASADDAFLLLAAAAGKQLTAIGGGRFSDIARWSRGELDDQLGVAMGDPFADDRTHGTPFALDDAIALLSGWRRQFEANRELAGAVGFARWKRPTTSVMLWDGVRPVRYPEALDRVRSGTQVATWSSKLTIEQERAIGERGLRRAEVEDGFIRSVGLGVNCVPPLSIIVDPSGAHFDPSRATGLERLLVEGGISEGDLSRAKALRQRLNDAGITKYAGRSAGGVAGPRPSPGRVVLVTGQVEDDRSVLLGGGAIRTNADLLAQVRAIEPDAYIIYRPHPDVMTGLRAGSVDEAEALALADAIDAVTPIVDQIAMVDEVHVLTSLAGFEALLRGKAVTTHGVPFYAGWGLTRDLGAVPTRRNRTVTIDELVAAALIAYPRYLDPVTGWPCPVEVLVARMEQGVQVEETGLLPGLRRMQGWLYRQRDVARREMTGRTRRLG